MTESHATPSPPTAPRPPITDSLWFWLVVYGSMAVVALAAIAPKHAKRQERIDRMGQARQEVWRKQVEGRTPGASEDPPDDVALPSRADPADGDSPASEARDDKHKKRWEMNPLPMLLVVSAVLWLAGSVVFVLLPRLSRRYYPHLTPDAPPTSQAP
jgi:hypothetical protein